MQEQPGSVLKLLHKQMHFISLILKTFVLAIIGGGKKNSNSLAHPNPPTNCLSKPTYLINGQMGASPIRPN